MYSNKLAAAIKYNGKVLREFKDTVYIPFASEYSILVKNLETRRAIVNIYIDGDCVTGSGLVLNAGQEVDLERFIKNGNLSEGNRFKFIERTGNIEQHRGVKLEDGLIRIEHQFEHIRPIINDYGHPLKTFYNDGGSGIYPQGSTLRSMNISCSTSSYDATSVNSSHSLLNDVGITVPGSQSNQKFSVASWFPTENIKHSMVIKLLGQTIDNVQVTRPVTVKHKPKCTTCGKQNKATAKFCVECGTALEIFA